MIWSCLYYDAKGRLVQEHAAQAPQEMWTSTYFAYDFPGNIISRRTKHFRYSNTVADEVYTYDYDGWDRPRVTTHQLGTGPVVTLSSLTYDRVGRLSSESRSGGNSGLETAFSYNIRSWLTDISVGSSGNTFRQRLYYNEARDGATANSYQWGGNISRMDWKLNGEATDRTYQFGYDFLSRLTGAAFTGPSDYSDNFSRTYSYDANSNMTSRGGAVFAYDGNHLSTGTYDSNGNMTEVNGNSITYNLLNLPSMAVSSDRTSCFTYTSDGVKVAKDVIEDNQITQTSYAGNLIAHFSSLEALLIEGGYVDLTGSAPAYRFYITDHQGNIRAVTDTTGTILRSNQYDPYGEEVLPIPVSGSQPASTAGTDAASRFMYGSKEWDKELSLYDFSARYYAPEGAVSFTTMDPLCEKYYNISPYAYCASDPMNHIDPQGDTVLVNNTGYIISNDDVDGVVMMQDGDKRVFLGNLYGTINIDIIYSNLLYHHTKESRFMDPFTLKAKVNNGGIWDLKANKDTIFGLGNNQTTFIFHGEKMESQDVGNHHFGAVVESNLYIPLKLALWRAGKNQREGRNRSEDWIQYKEHGFVVNGRFKSIIRVYAPPYGDDPRDQYWIIKGWDYQKNR